MDKRVAIIDVDSIIWTTAYLNRDQHEHVPVKHSLYTFLSQMLRATSATHYAGLMGGASSETFRKKLFPSYKSTRPEKPEWMIKWEDFIREYLLVEWKFQELDDIEADDAVSILAARCRKDGTNYVICGVDKDLKQIPGLHYNYTKDSFEEVGIGQASYNLFYQVLIGDTVDHIGGCPGIGKVKAPKILRPEEPLNNRGSNHDNVIGAFTDKLGIREGLAKFSETYLLVRLLEESDIEIKLIEYNNGSFDHDTLFT